MDKNEEFNIGDKVFVKPGNAGKGIIGTITNITLCESPLYWVDDYSQGVFKEELCKVMERPPIGIIPELHWKYKRIIDLDAAIERYKDFYGEHEMIKTWFDERMIHTQWIYDNHPDFCEKYFTHEEEK